MTVKLEEQPSNVQPINNQLESIDAKLGMDKEVWKVLGFLFRYA
ncbi:hypothetical protein [Desulfosporosinus nitroreducens]|nr:hypothetical protein [Desulfosporosinus nitroreducens]